MRTPRAFVLLTIAAAALPLYARASEIHVTSSTQYDWYADPLASDKDQREFDQYLRLNGTLDDKGNIGVFGYGRLSGQLTTGGETDHYWTGRFYYLYVQARDLLGKHLDLRAGRTYVTEAAIPGVIDGAYVNLKNLEIPGLGLTVFGGHRVKFDQRKEVDDFGDTLFGGSLTYATVRQTHVELSFARRYIEGDLGREAIAAEAGTTPVDNLNFFGRARYDLAGSRWNELLLQANVVPTTPLTLKGEYYASRPSFDKFSFYNFFNVTDYRQASAGAEFQLNPRYRFFGNYAHEWFDASATANRFDVGVGLNPIDNLRLTVRYEKRVGYAGGIDGIRFDGWYGLGAVALLAGIDYDDFRRDSTDLTYSTRSSTARRFWGGVSYAFTKYLDALARVEDDVNFYFSPSYKGFVAVNVKL